MMFEGAALCCGGLSVAQVCGELRAAEDCDELRAAEDCDELRAAEDCDELDVPANKEPTSCRACLELLIYSAHMFCDFQPICCWSCRDDMPRSAAQVAVVLEVKIIRKMDTDYRLHTIYIDYIDTDTDSTI